MKVWFLLIVSFTILSNSLTQGLFLVQDSYMKPSLILLLMCVSVAGCAPIAAQNRQVDALNRLQASSYQQVRDYSIETTESLRTIGEAATIEAAKNSVTSLMKDPDSTKFRNVRLQSYLSGKIVCGEVNSKNSYGGYIGFHGFVAGTTGATLYDKDNRNPVIQNASNAGIFAACGY